MQGMESRGSEDLDAVTTQHVRGALAGDAASVEWMVARFSPLLLAQAAHRLRGPLGRRFDPEDIVQDVWSRALPRLKAVTPRDGRFTPVVLRFLATTLLNRMNSLMQVHLRGGNARTGEIDAIGGECISDDATQAVDRALRGERESAVRKAIEEMSEDDRAVVVLRGIEQNPLADVALLLEENPNTIAVRYRRALARLREALPKSIFDELLED